MKDMKDVKDVINRISSKYKDEGVTANSKVIKDLDRIMLEVNLHSEEPYTEKELLAFAKQYENSKVTKDEICNIWGSIKARDHITKVGYFRSPSIEKSLITTLEQYFHSVEKGKPREFAYVLGEARDEVVPREDGRFKNED